MKRAMWIILIIILIVVASLFIIYARGFSSERENESCVTNLTNYYQNQSTLLTQETGNILVEVGYMDEVGRNEVIEMISQRGINFTFRGERFLNFKVPIGEEIKWTCNLLGDKEIKRKVISVTPDFVSNRPPQNIG